MVKEEKLYRRVETVRNRLRMNKFSRKDHKLRFGWPVPINVTVRVDLVHMLYRWGCEKMFLRLYLEIISPEKEYFKKF